MEKEQIIKALECCQSGDSWECARCPRHSFPTTSDNECMEDLIRDALALIKELTEDNEAQAETIKSLIETIKDVKADTVREMQERFEELMGNEYTSCGFCNAVGYWSVKAVKDNIDRIANEILNKNTEEEKK